MAKKLMIISDLHIGAGVLDDCDKELESQLVRFLEYVEGQPEPVELVINGDFFDFAQAEPWAGKALESATADGVSLCFTAAQSLVKLENICKAHRPLLVALAKLAQSPQHRIVVMPGNHDADFFWPEVREALAAELKSAGGSAGLRFHLERQYRPQDFNHVWIEHGNQFDPVNDFYVTPKGKPKERRLLWGADCPPILPDVTGKPRLVECLGTKFLIHVINRLDEHYPYIDNVKPFSRMFRILRDSALDPRDGSRKFGAAYWHIAKFVKDRMRSPEGRSDLLSQPEDCPTSASWLRTEIEAMSELRKRKLTKRLAETDIGLNDSLMTALDDPDFSERLMQAIIDDPDTLLPLLETDSADTLSLAQGALPVFGFDETKALKRAARDLLHGDIKLVVFGHTHERVDEPGYINSGSWTRYWIDKRKAPRWSDLKSSGGNDFPFELNFVEVSYAKPQGMLVNFEAVSTPDRSRG